MLAWEEKQRKEAHGNSLLILKTKSLGHAPIDFSNGEESHITYQDTTPPRGTALLRTYPLICTCHLLSENRK